MNYPHRPQLDPYLRWGLESNFSGFKAPTLGSGGQRILPVAVQLKHPEDFAAAKNLMHSVPDPYISQPSAGTSFFSGLINESNIDPMLRIAKRVRLGLPSTPTVRSGTFFQPVSLVPLTVVGLIDNGIAFLNSSFRTTTGSSRFFAMWDQEDDPQPKSPWQPTKFQYGRQIDRSSIDKLLAAVAAGTTEDSIYRALNYLPCQRRVAHGTHILDLAAGSIDPVTRKLRVDIAAEIPIVAVQLPSKPFKDTSGSSLAVHVLDGLRYIMGSVRSNDRVVVNISDGAYAGAHDGTSLLEEAIDDLIREFAPRLHVVIAAGNGYLQRLHAQWKKATKLPPKIQFRLLPDVLTDTFVEFWCPTSSHATLKVKQPDGTVTNCSISTSATITDKSGANIGGIFPSDNPFQNGSSRISFLVALSATRPGGTGRSPAPHGIWEFELTGVTAFDAYVQRNNPALGDNGPRRQSYFVDDTKHPKYITGHGTLNNIATGERTYVVGGYFRSGAWFDSISGQNWQVAPYSSQGPGRKGAVPGVNVLAPSEDSPSLHGVLGAGVRSGTSVRVDGTSVAAPLVTRWVANAISGFPPTTHELKPPSFDSRP